MKRTTTKAVQTASRPQSSSSLRYQIQQEAEFMQEYGHLSNAEVADAAFEMDMLGFKLRHMLWNRLGKQTQTN